MVEKLPSFINRDYRRLVKDLYYFLDDDDHTYSISKVQSFTKKWRQRWIESLDQFKHYHRKYLELVGKAAGSKSITEVILVNTSGKASIPPSEERLRIECS